MHKTNIKKLFEIKISFLEHIETAFVRYCQLRGFNN